MDPGEDLLIESTYTNWCKETSFTLPWGVLSSLQPPLDSTDATHRVEVYKAIGVLVH